MECHVLCSTGFLYLDEAEHGKLDSDSAITTCDGLEGMKGALETNLI